MGHLYQSPVAPEAEGGPGKSLTLRARKLVSSCSPVGHELAGDLEQISGCCLLKTLKEAEEVDCSKRQNVLKHNTMQEKEPRDEPTP